MKLKTVASLAMATCIACIALLRVQADDKHHAHADTSSLKPFAQLVGEWVGKGNHDGKEMDVHVIYKVTSAGSAVVETLFPGTDHEMITVIHPDGDSLLLTHYCSHGNQPQMRAKPKAGDTRIAFDFVKATNLKSDKDSYMRSVTYTIADKDTLKAEWTNYNEGKEAGKVAFELKRKK